MSKNGCGYVGKIKSGGPQKVTAPIDAKAKKGKSTVKKGSDLRVK